VRRIGRGAVRIRLPRAFAGLRFVGFSTTGISFELSNVAPNQLNRSNHMTHHDTDLVSEFVVESLEHLADVETQLLEIEAAGAEVDVDLINRVFRAVHSTKGAAGFLGFHKIGDLAHEIENILNRQRNREIVASGAMTDALLRGIDCLRSMLGAIDASNDVDVSEHVTALKRFDQAAGSQADAASSHDCRSSNDADAAPTAAAAPRAAVAAAGASTGGSQNGPEGSIRVPVGILDRLMTLAGELVLGRNQLLQGIESRDTTCLEPVAARIDQVTSELQAAVMHSRMQPIGTVFGRFARIVRDLSAQLGKQCSLEVEGNEVELDKTIIEAIGDPLTHLIRNSLDHGIERPEVRTRHGKRPQGNVHLSARHRAGKVLISIVDDGAGIDVAKVKQKAVSNGILTAEQAASMGDRDAVRLIFHPGLSTAEKVSEVSGRGVGMDVVKTNIEKIGGTVDVETLPGHGTTIQVELPLTLAIIPSLIVHCGGERFAVPQSSISELVRIKSGEVASHLEHVNDAELLRLRGKLLPLVRLGAALAQAPSDHSSEAAVNILVVEADQLRYGIVVDGLNDSEEIVVKPLGRHLKGCPCLAGATVLGDGQVALILDVAGIASHMRLTRTAETDSADEASLALGRAGAETQATLLFANHPGELFAVPMAVIKRIERVTKDRLIVVGGCDLLQYDDDALPLVRLEKHLNVEPQPDVSRAYVIVFEFGGREVGLLVPTIIDIREISTDVDVATFRERGIVGSLVLDRKTVRIVDVFDLAGVAHPEWARPQRKPLGAEARATRILLAEDSDFFRRQVAAFLESHQHAVTGCEDGQAAWEELSQADVPYDLIVTDVEMPQLNGFEFCRRVKDDSRFAHLPVIALTSLAGQEDVERGTLAGIDDYQVKMDRDRLLSAVNRLLKSSAGRIRRPAQV
jgi:two-component system chemotaxis sensor kinase CheA